MKTKIIKTAVVLLLIFSFTLGGCWIVCTPFVPPGFTRIYTDNNYISEYTPEQHVERISEIFETDYEDAVKNSYYKVKEYDIYTIYSFDDKPEYFLIEICWEVTCIKNYNNKWTETHYSHDIGIIYHDEYYRSAVSSGVLGLTMQTGSRGNGKSIYSRLGVLGQDKKLLFSNTNSYCGYLGDDGKVYGLYAPNSERPNIEDLREIEPKEFPELAKREPFNAEKFCYVR